MLIKTGSPEKIINIISEKEIETIKKESLISKSDENDKSEDKK